MDTALTPAAGFDLTTSQAAFIEECRDQSQIFIRQPYELYSPANQQTWRTLYERMLPTLQRVTEVGRGRPHTTAEDFAYFAIETPGLYVNLANGPEGGDPRYAAPNHSPLFDMYEPNLEIGVRVFANLVVDYLQQAAE